nr:immunoglobulin heavy chain junction region [Mus musculus]
HISVQDLNWDLL